MGLKWNVFGYERSCHTHICQTDGWNEHVIRGNRVEDSSYYVFQWFTDVLSNFTKMETVEMFGINSDF